jgi:superfamily II DNA/RNA helicase
MQWPSLGKETHGKCLSFGVVAIRFLVGVVEPFLPFVLSPNLLLDTGCSSALTVGRGVDFRINMVINYDLPSSGIHVHRIGRTGRGVAKEKITLFTEADFDNLRTIANVMKRMQSRGLDAQSIA